MQPEEKIKLMLDFYQRRDDQFSRDAVRVLSYAQGETIIDPPVPDEVKVVRAAVTTTTTEAPRFTEPTTTTTEAPKRTNPTTITTAAPVKTANWSGKIRR